MAKTRQQKEEMLTELKNAFSTAKSVVITAFSEVGVNVDQKVRAKLREEGVDFKVVKKTLFKKAIAHQGWDNLDIAHATGNIAVALSQTDEVAPAKQLADAKKEHGGFALLGGVMIQDTEAVIMSEEEIATLAKLPSRDELIAKVVGSIGSPLRGLVSVLSGPQRSLVQVLGAISEHKS